MNDDETTDLLDIPAKPEKAALNTDDNAQEESLLIAKDRYEEDRRKHDHRRAQGLKNAAYCGLQALIILGIILVCCALVIWAIHVMGPQNWRWLSVNELDRLQIILFSGALASALTQTGKQLL